MNKYIVYMDDGMSAFKVTIPAKNIKKAMEYVRGNGEIIRIKDITDSYTIDTNDVYEALASAHFDYAAIELITRALDEIGITE